MSLSRVMLAKEAVVNCHNCQFFQVKEINPEPEPPFNRIKPDCFQAP